MPLRAAMLLPALVACASRGAGPSYSAAPAAADAGANLTAAYVVRLGTDTLTVERVTWSDTTITGQMVGRSPAPFARSYTVRLGPDGRATRFEADTRPLSGATPPASHVVVDLAAADSVRWEITSGTAPTRRGAVAVPAGGTLVPFANNTFGVFSLLTEQARRAGRDSVALAIVGAGAQQPVPALVRRIGGDSVTVALGQPAQPPFRLRVDARGRVLGMQGFETTQKVLVERVPAVDMAAIEQSFATRGIAQLSTRDSLSVAVGGAQVFVDYGRPFARGRTIVGGVVPYDSVWRTGANFATVLRTDKDIVINGQTVPAGKYTLWTLPTRAGWKLIINKKTLDERGNPLWGTMYDATQDLARIDVRSETLPQPVEQFTIAVEPRGAADGVIRLSWGGTGVVVPFTVKQ
jgi:hypothetical protein